MSFKKSTMRITVKPTHSAVLRELSNMTIIIIEDKMRLL
jgi:hypothetical protein